MFKKISIIVLIAIGCLAYGQQKADVKNAPRKIKDGIDYSLIGAPLPPVRLVTLDTLSPDARLRSNTNNDTLHRQHITKEYSELELKNKANLFVMIFNPVCSHCEDETELLEKNITMFKRSKLVLMANASMKTYLGDFIKFMKVKDYPSIIIGLDSSGFIDRTFLFNALPQINIYDKHRKLIKTFSGEIPIDSLKMYAK